MNYVTVTDANGCTATDSSLLGEATQLMLTIGDTVVSCHGFNDGALVAYPTQGTGPYSYRWNSPIHSQTHFK